MLNDLYSQMARPATWAGRLQPTPGGSQTGASELRRESDLTAASAGLALERSNRPATQPKPFVDEVIARAIALKVATAHLSMHLQESRWTLFRKRISQVLDPEELETGTKLIEVAAYNDLLKLIVAEDIARVPALGISDAGDLLAAWWNADPEARLFAKFSRRGFVDLTFASTGKAVRVCSRLGEVRKTLRSYGFSDAGLDGDA